VPGTSERKEEVGKGGRRVNTVQKMCTHVSKCNNDTCSIYSRNGGGWVKESSGGGELKYVIFDTL
jgi:SH3-like domain-containing protein